MKKYKHKDPVGGYVRFVGRLSNGQQTGLTQAGSLLRDAQGPCHGAHEEVQKADSIIHFGARR